LNAPLGASGTRPLPLREMGRERGEHSGHGQGIPRVGSAKLRSWQNYPLVPSTKGHVGQFWGPTQVEMLNSWAGGEGRWILGGPAILGSNPRLLDKSPAEMSFLSHFSSILSSPRLLLVFTCRCLSCILGINCILDQISPWNG